MRFAYLPPHRRVVASTRQRVFATRAGLWALGNRQGRSGKRPQVAPRAHEPGRPHERERERVEREADRRRRPGREDERRRTEATTTSAPTPAAARNSPTGRQCRVERWSITASTTRVVRASARQSPASRRASARAQASGTWSATTASATSRSPRVRDCTKRSGNVTENPMAKTIHGESSATRRPSSSPTSAEYPAPSTAPTSDAPASAKTPAAAPTATSASQDDETTWRATPAGSSPIRVSGTDVTRPSEDGDRDERRRREVRVPEARHRADSLPRRERQTDQVDGLERERERDAPCRHDQPLADAARPTAACASRHRLRGRVAPSATIGKATATRPLSAIPTATASIPSASTRDDDVSQSRSARERCTRAPP